MFTHPKRAIEIFSNLVKKFRAGPISEEEKLVKVAWPLESHIFWWFFPEKNCEVIVLKSILHRKSFCSRRNFRQCKPFFLKCSKRINVLSFVRFITGRFPPIFLLHKKKVAQKLLLSSFCFRDSFLLKQFWYFLVY